MTKKVLVYLVMVFAVAGFVWAAQGGEDGEVEKRVRVHKIVADCDGEDCTEHAVVSHSGRHAIFIGEDGEATVVGDGPMVWSGGGGGFLGVGLTELTPELREHFGLSADAGVMVSKVVAGGPADNAGIEVGDIITALDGAAVKSGGSLAMRVRKLDENETAAVELWRDGRLQTASVQVEERVAPRAHRMAFRCDDGDCESLLSGDANALFLHCDGGDCGSVEKRVVRIECDGDDCAPGDMNFDFDFNCGEENCQVQVMCDGEDCNCTVNGESADCAAFGH
ncbi:MAG: PDZ domain-containing protein [Acidobacteriota bacterium]